MQWPLACLAKQPLPSLAFIHEAARHDRLPLAEITGTALAAPVRPPQGIPEVDSGLSSQPPSSHSECRTGQRWLKLQPVTCRHQALLLDGNTTGAKCPRWPGCNPDVHASSSTNLVIPQRLAAGDCAVPEPAAGAPAEPPSLHDASAAPPPSWPPAHAAAHMQESSITCLGCRDRQQMAT